MITRRDLLRSMAGGVPAAALTGLLSGEDTHGVVFPRHVRPRAKRVIHLCMAGGPSHLETLDWKPKLREMHGEPMPESFTQGQQLAQLQGQKLVCFGPQHEFQRYGESGNRLCSLFPHLGAVADELCIVNSLHGQEINHDPAHTLMNTGSGLSGRPSMGSWFTYGLGRMAEDLPAYVVLTSKGRGGQGQPIAARQWSAGFLPGRFQGVHFQSAGSPVHYLENPPGVEREEQGRVVEAVRDLDRIGSEENPALATRIAQYELAFRMQASVPELVDFSDEPEEVFELYGTRGGDGTYAANCLLARRLLERDVRFVQLYHRAWDHHGRVKRDMEICAEEVDRASAALITDLKRRGLLEDTLIFWGGEFGRTPMGQGDGRDHHIKGFSCWMAGGGVNAGTTYGATDELGYAAEVDPVSIHDLHATILHQLGIDHERLLVRFQGRDYRLTDVHGHVVEGLLA